MCSLRQQFFWIDINAYNCHVFYQTHSSSNQPPSVSPLAVDVFVFLFLLQQTLIGITAPLSAALVVSEVVCAQKDDAIKQFILSASTFMVGVATFLMSTFGVR